MLCWSYQVCLLARFFRHLRYYVKHEGMYEPPQTLIVILLQRNEWWPQYVAHAIMWLPESAVHSAQQSSEGRSWWRLCALGCGGGGRDRVLETAPCRDRGEGGAVDRACQVSGQAPEIRRRDGGGAREGGSRARVDRRCQVSGGAPGSTQPRHFPYLYPVIQPIGGPVHHEVQIYRARWLGVAAA